MEQLSGPLFQFFNQYWFEVTVSVSLSIVAAVFSYRLKSHLARKSTIELLAKEIFEIFKVMHFRKYPEDPDHSDSGHWSRSAEREQWMLKPYYHRVRYLKDHARDNGHVRYPVMTAIRHFESSLDEYIAFWAASKNRAKNFASAYDSLEVSARKVLESLDKSEDYKDKIDKMREFHNKHRNDDVVQPPADSVDQSDVHQLASQEDLSVDESGLRCQ